MSPPPGCLVQRVPGSRSASFCPRCGGAEKASVASSMPKAEAMLLVCAGEMLRTGTIRVEHRNVALAAEVAEVECQDSGDSVRRRDRGKSGIVHFRAFHFVRDDQTPPLAKCLW